MEVKEVFTLSDGSVEYILGNSIDFGFFFPLKPYSFSEKHAGYRDLNGDLVNFQADSLDYAVKVYLSYLYDSGQLERPKKVLSHGGNRLGSGRKKKLPTKPVRLNEREQTIIENFRSSNVDEFKLAKMIIRLMADLENNSV